MICLYFFYGSLQLTNIGRDVLCDIVYDLRLQKNTNLGSLVADDGHPCFVVRRLDVHDQARFEAGAETVFQFGDFRRRTVGSEYDLPFVFKKRVESMEELLLCLDFAGNKLDIVHQKQVGISVLFPEFEVFARLDGIDELVGEIVSLDINDVVVRVAFPDPKPDRVEQMGLAQTGVAVNEKRIVFRRIAFGHCLSSGMCHPV